MQADQLVCPGCGRDIREQEPWCPHCGLPAVRASDAGAVQRSLFRPPLVPITQRAKRWALRAAVAGGAMVFLGFVVALAASAGPLWRLGVATLLLGGGFVCAAYALHGAASHAEGLRVAPLRTAVSLALSGPHLLLAAALCLGALVAAAVMLVPV